MDVIKYSIMKFLSVIAFIVYCCLNSLNAQDTIKKNKIYRTWISLNSEPFKIKGCYGKDKARKFSEICCAVSLAGEISIASAMTAHHFSNAHQKLGRKM